jgi:Flp pilus assembly secretin CpaC
MSGLQRRILPMACVALSLLMGGAKVSPGGEPVAFQPPVAAPLKLAAGKQLLFRSKANIHRTTVGDPEVCNINQFSASELAIVARAPGQTEVTFWFTDPANTPLTYVVEVR